MTADRLAVAAAVVWRGDHVLLTQRPPGGRHPLLWEFPGGKVEPGETPEAALAREVREELGVGARPLERLGAHRHDYPGGPSVEIVFVRCELEPGEPSTGPAVHALRWVRPEDVDLAEVLDGDHAFLVELGARRA